MTRPNPFRAVAAAASICGVEGLRAQGVHVDRETFDLALDVVWRLGDDRLTPVPVVEPDRNSSDDGYMSASDVAASVDVTARAIRKAAEKGFLAGSKDDSGRWRFTFEAVEDWKATR